MNAQNDVDRLVEAYLRQLTKAAEPLPEDRKTHLVEEVTAHITEARAEGVTTEAETRKMLAQLGSPDDIVAAATDGLVLVDRFQPRYRSREVAALLLLPFGAFLALIGWGFGVLMLWTSDRWTRREKWLGTLVWPLGYLFVYVAITFPAPGQWTMPVWLAIPVLLLIGIAPLLVLILLIKNAQPRRSAS